MSGDDPSVVYRWFTSIDLTATGRRFQISSALLNTQNVSVHDGALGTAQEAAAAGARLALRPVGVIAVPKTAITKEAATIEIDPNDNVDDPNYLAQHRILKGISSKKAKRLRNASRVVVPLAGYDVGDGEVKEA